MPVDRPPPYFVGNHPAIDFLNTIATPEGIVIDWICDGQDFGRWLEDARAIYSVGAAKAKTCRRPARDEGAVNARECREWLRKFVMSRKGKRLRATAVSIAALNERLARDKSFPHVHVAGRNS